MNDRMCRTCKHFLRMPPESNRGYCHNIKMVDLLFEKFWDQDCDYPDIVIEIIVSETCLCDEYEGIKE